MGLNIEKETVLQASDAHGVVQVGGTQVTLDTIVFTFKEGAMAEKIVNRYPSLSLADVHDESTT